MSIFEAFMMITIVVGGSFALYKLGVFRDLKPHLTLEQEVTHRQVGDDYLHVAVRVTLINSSKVAMEIREAEFLTLQIDQLSNEEIETLYSEHISNEGKDYIQWPQLQEILKTWGRNELVIEPNGRHYELYEIVVSNQIKCMLLSSYFANTKYRDGNHTPQGWEVVSILDVD